MNKITRKEICSALKKILLTLFFIACKMKLKFCFGVIEIKLPIKNINKPRRDKEASMSGQHCRHLLKKFFNKSTQQLIKVSNF